MADPKAGQVWVKGGDTRTVIYVRPGVGNVTYHDGEKDWHTSGYAWRLWARGAKLMGGPKA